MKRNDDIYPRRDSYSFDPEKPFEAAGLTGRKRISYVRWMFSIVLLIPLLVFWLLLVKGYLINFVVISRSMEPSIQVNDRLLFQATVPDDLRGKIIAFRAVDNGEMLTKRVLAQDGDNVKIRSGEIYLNFSDTPVPGPQLESGGNQSWDVPEGHIFVVGDNRNDSEDSTEWGPIPRDRVVGVLWYRYYPWAQAGSVE